ncbi:CC-NBS-LRR resistance protein, putative [Medicago truncatula]|uniref:CC-NBS-LRR resistance protein, putative n=1 Tax=Medicago truncatula TaxID=3880 RepID=G7J2J1_MEDTR|nr:CC-NBS-LRR resistance protein, putative [Medicago truncatula]
MDEKYYKQLLLLGKLPCLTALFVSATEKAFLSLKTLTFVWLREGFGGRRSINATLHQRLVLNIEYVPKFVIENLTGISTFHLLSLCISNFTRLKELPVELSTLTALEHLNIPFCHETGAFFEHLFEGLSSLRTLSVISCLILKSLSNGIRQVTCLETLKIHHCPLFVFPHNMTSLPDWLGAMTSLQRLQISGFPKLSSLPDSFHEVWHYIAHIPALELKSTFCENIVSAWNMGKQLWMIEIL